MANNNKTDAEKHRYWQRTIGEAARSGVSIREFWRQRRLRDDKRGSHPLPKPGGLPTAAPCAAGCLLPSAFRFLPRGPVEGLAEKGEFGARRRRLAAVVKVAFQAQLVALLL